MLHAKRSPAANRTEPSIVPVVLQLLVNALKADRLMTTGHHCRLIKQLFTELAKHGRRKPTSVLFINVDARLFDETLHSLIDRCQLRTKRCHSEHLAPYNSLALHLVVVGIIVGWTVVYPMSFYSATVAHVPFVRHLFLRLGQGLHLASSTHSHLHHRWSNSSAPGHKHWIDSASL